MKLFALLMVMAVAAFAGDAQENNGDYAGLNAGPEGGIGSWQYPMAVLYDNGPFVTGVGTGSGGADISEENSGETTYGFGVQFGSSIKLADQFEVPAGETWDIESITVFGYQTGSGTTSTITGVYLCVYDDPPDSGTLVYGDFTTNIMTSTEWTNCYRVGNAQSTNTDRPIMATTCDVTPFSLPAGEYWMAFMMDGSGSSGPWGNPITITGQPATGDAKQEYPVGTWLPLAMGGTDQPVGIPFILEGTGGSALVRSSWGGIKTSF